MHALSLLLLKAAMKPHSVSENTSRCSWVFERSLAILMRALFFFFLSHQAYLYSKCVKAWVTQAADPEKRVAGRNIMRSSHSIKTHKREGSGTGWRRKSSIKVMSTEDSDTTTRSREDKITLQYHSTLHERSALCVGQ